MKQLEKRHCLAEVLIHGSLKSLDAGDETTLSSTWPADSEIFAQLRGPIHPHHPAQLQDKQDALYNRVK